MLNYKRLIFLEYFTTIIFRTKGDLQTSSSSLCVMKDNFFNFEQFVLGSDLSGKAWQNVLLGLTSSPSQPFSPKISDSLANYLYCVDQCSSQTGFGQDLPARNIQRGRDHGIPGTNIKYILKSRIFFKTMKI